MQISSKISTIQVASLLFMEACSQPYEITTGHPQSEGSAPDKEIASQPDPEKEVPLQPKIETPEAPRHVQEFPAKSRMTLSKEMSPLVRILFVVDNSKSTDAYQAVLTRGFESFARKYFRPNLNLSTAVIYTDTYKRRQKRGFNPVISFQNIGAAGDNGKKMVRDFEMQARPGSKGASSERGFESIHTYLRDSGESLFSRRDAQTGPVPVINIVVTVSDEHDQSFSDFGIAGMPRIDHRWQAYRAQTNDQIQSSAKQLAQAFNKRLDTFFASSSGQPNYAFFAITNVNCNRVKSPCDLQRDHLRNHDEAWGLEYTTLIDLVKSDPTNQLGHNSQSYDINESDYDKLFTWIGSKVIQENRDVLFNRFTLDNPLPDGATPRVELLLLGGKKKEIPREWVTVIDSRTLEIATSYQGWIPEEDGSARIRVGY